MGQGISTVLGFAVGVAVSPVPIIALILMLFSERARVNGPIFLLGWVVALAVVSGIAYAVADGGDASTSTTSADTIAWGKIVFGLVFLVLALRMWRARPASGAEAELPGWMAGIDAFTPGKALAFGVLLAGVNPKNLMLAIAAGTALATLGLATGQAFGSLVVFVVLASLTIAAPVGYYLVGGQKAVDALTELKGWLGVHNDAVMTVLFLVLGVDLIAQGLPPLT
jgi:hypothetical protein